jgi:integrase
MDRSPCRGIRLPELTPVERPLASAEEVEQLMAATPRDYRVAVLLGALGLRQGEVFGLCVGAIDFLRKEPHGASHAQRSRGPLVEGCGKRLASARTISLRTRVVDELSAHLARTEPDALGVQAPEGGPSASANFRLRIYDPALRRARRPGLNFHRLRHSAGPVLREAGVPLEVIERRLGHASIRTTADIYGSLPERVDRPVADKLDELVRAAANSCGADVVQVAAGGLHSTLPTA